MNNGRNSFAILAEQVVKNNKNSLEIMAKLDQLVSSNDSTVDVVLMDETGNPITYSFPTVGFLKSEIERINTNVQTLASISTNGAFIRDADNAFKKIIVADLNREPNSLSALNTVTDFRSDKNWFFDALLNPLLSVVVDLTDKVEDNVRKCLTRRYIVKFSQNEDGSLTSLGESARNSFNELFKGRQDVGLEEFETWHSTTAGVQNPTTPLIDEQLFDLEPNELLYDGTFTVISTEEDTVNKKLWYHLDSITYLETVNNVTKDLAVGDEVIINNDISTTRYRISEVSTASSQFRVRFERIEGFEPIPVGIGTLKIYSPLVLNKNVKISIGFNEYNVLFAKPMNTENHLLAKNWSLGTAYYTNDLRLTSEDSDNGMSMSDYYVQKVYDYGLILQDLVAKKKPNALGEVPNVVTLKQENFKVVQINKHLTDTIDANDIRTKNNLKNTLKSEIDQLDQAILDKQRELQTRRFSSDADRQKSQTQLQGLVEKKDSRSKLLTSTVTEVLSLSKNITNADPKFRVRGFWDIPEPVQAFNSQPQEVIGFRIQYKYQSKSGSENLPERFKVVPVDVSTAASSSTNANNLSRGKEAFFSNWVEIKTDVRKRTYDPVSNVWTWEIEDVSDADTPNVNQLDIPIQAGEKVEIRIKSISEVGYPEAPIESDWSESLIVEFPEDLNQVLGENDFILQEATQEEQRIKFQQELNSKGLGQHLADSITVEDKYLSHKDETIATHYFDSNNKVINLKDYLDTLTNKIIALEEQLKRAKGELKIRVFRGTQEYAVINGAQLEFNVECEDYGILNDDTIPRVYKDFDIYRINDFYFTVENIAQESPLGLLSNRTYVNSPENSFHNQTMPQSFWINNNDQLILNSVTPGSTSLSRMQKDKQWIWYANVYNNLQTSEAITVSGGNSITSNNGTTINNPFLNVSGGSIPANGSLNLGYSNSSTNLDGGSTDLLVSVLNNDLWDWPSALSGDANSHTRFGTIVHPSVQTLEDIVANNAEGLKNIAAGSDGIFIVPIYVYFKFDVVNVNAPTDTFDASNVNIIRSSRSRTLRFFLEPENSARAFDFSIKFNFYNKRSNLVNIVTGPVVVR